MKWTHRKNDLVKYQGNEPLFGSYGFLLRNNRYNFIYGGDKKTVALIIIR